MNCRRIAAVVLVSLVAALLASVGAAQIDPLPSWNDGPAKRGVIAFVQAVTDRGSPRYVPPEERIATFDNDGTLWCEQPMPRTMAASHSG